MSITKKSLSILPKLNGLHASNSGLLQTVKRGRDSIKLKFGSIGERKWCIKALKKVIKRQLITSHLSSTVFLCMISSQQDNQCKL